MVIEVNFNILLVSSFMYFNLSDMFMLFGIIEIVQIFVVLVILIFNNFVKIIDVKVIVDNVYKIVIEVLLENGVIVEKKVRFFMFKIILFNEDLKKKI